VVALQNRASQIAESQPAAAAFWVIDEPIACMLPVTAAALPVVWIRTTCASPHGNRPAAKPPQRLRVTSCRSVHRLARYKRMIQL
jgi:hypothetical protein